MENNGLHIRLAQENDIAFLAAQDPHISAMMRQRKIAAGEILIALAEHEPIGFLRWGWFWDTIPFMNMLIVVEMWRRKGVATRLITDWEAAMQEKNAECVLTSTLSNETAQHLYRKCGYQDLGGFIMPNEPLELVLFKQLPSSGR